MFAINGTTGIGTLTSSTAAFLTTNPLKVGDVIRWSNLTGAAAVDNGVNLRVAGVTGTTVTLVPPPAGVIAFATGLPEVITVVGKKLTIPQSSQVMRSFTIEEWQNDTSESQLWLGNRVTQISLNIPPSGFVMLQANVQGVSLTRSSSRVYSTPTALSSTKALTAVSGKVSYNGLDVAVITSMNLVIAADASAPPVVGSPYVPEIFAGMLHVTGSFTSLLTNDTITDDFMNENEVVISILLTTDPTNSADFVSITLPRVKLTSTTRSDSDREISRSFNFVALEQTAGGVGTQYDATSIVIQDSLA